MEEIRFNDSGKKIHITIDNETQDIPIKKIDKFKTFITLNQSLNTPLKEDIVIDASLNFLSYDETNENLEYIDNSSIDIDYTQSTEDIEGNNQVTINQWESGAENITPQTATKKTDLNGIVNITIYDENKVYYNQTISFNKGSIQHVIKNNLSIGEYKAIIEFSGNKYLQPATLNVDFNIEKRLAFFTFDKEDYYADPNQTIVISGTLKDSLTKKIVKECAIKFDFDSETYSTSTNMLGQVFLEVTVPDADITHCLMQPNNEDIDISNNEPGDEYEDDPEEHLDFDDDGNIIEITEEDILDVPFTPDDYTNTNNENQDIFYQNIEDNNIEDSWDYGYPNASYLLSAYLVSDSYYVQDTTIAIIVNKILTEVEINQSSEVQNNIVSLQGKIISHYKNEDKRAMYGNITISFDDTDYISNKIPLNKYGEFDATIDFDEVQLSSNKSDISELIPYQKNLYQATITEITANNQVDIGEPITATATVHPIDSNATIQDGMVVFILKSNNKEVYRYGSQIDGTGRAVFFFNTSKKNVYEIYAHYYGLFGYDESESETKTIEVI